MNADEERRQIQLRLAALDAASKARENIHETLDSLDPKDAIDLVRELWDDLRPKRKGKQAEAPPAPADG